MKRNSGKHTIILPEGSSYLSKSECFHYFMQSIVFAAAVHDCLLLAHVPYILHHVSHACVLSAAVLSAVSSTATPCEKNHY